MEKEIISCVCMTCGIRNDHSNETGYCQNDHDDWLEYRDVMLIEGAEKEPLKRFAKQLGISALKARALFLDNSIKQFNFKS